MRARTRRTAALVAVTALAAAGVAEAISIPKRTFRVAIGINGARADGPSTRPTISGDGRLVAFESTASNLALDPNGPVSDVFVRDLPANRVRLISEGIGGAGANGPSEIPVISNDGESVAFVSTASNLVEGDTNGVRDVFARRGDAPVTRASVAHGGQQANGASGEPDVSEAGRFVVFTSEASNLIDGDTNGVADVYVRDLRFGRTVRVSSAAGGGNPDGPSGAPAISPDGRFVSFFSSARNLVADDSNGQPDVFLADLERGVVELVSVGRGRQQNQAVVPPFQQISDVSRGGRFVAFDSDATNLVLDDDNRDTDVFVRDTARGRTERVSLSLASREANNDSFSPRITPDGRFVSFESFAENLFPGDARGEDVFVRDRRLDATSLISVTATGRRRSDETVGQLLQRPALSNDAGVVTFTSTAPLTTDDDNAEEDAFVRITAPPRARIRIRGLRTRLSADDPAADVFLCRLGPIAGPCPRSANLRFLRRGSYKLIVRATGPGMLVGPRKVKRFRR